MTKMVRLCDILPQYRSVTFLNLHFIFFFVVTLSCIPLVPGATPLLLCSLRMETAIAHPAMFQGRLFRCAPLLLQRTKPQPSLPPSDRKHGPPLLSHPKNSKPRETAGSRRDTKIHSFALLLPVSPFLLRLQSF